MQIRTAEVPQFWFTWASGWNIAYDNGDASRSADWKQYRYKVSLVALINQPNILSPYNVANNNGSVASGGTNLKAGGDNMSRFTGSFHSGGINVALCDGSVRFISDSITATVFSSAGRIADGGPAGGIN